uniref:Uncharacterized protein n=1 Tax=Romanomermis culicivorax TaxID=13658 RepID=A0A915HUN7_ROMCU
MSFIEKEGERMQKANQIGDMSDGFMPEFRFDLWQGGLKSLEDVFRVAIYIVLALEDSEDKIEENIGNLSCTGYHALVHPMPCDQ